MASEEPVRMLESEPSSFELTELEAPDEELLGSFLPIGDVAKLIGVNPSVLRFGSKSFHNCAQQNVGIVAITVQRT